MKINPAIANEFSTAAFRFGHTLIRDKFTRYDENDQKIKAINFTDMSFKSDLAYNIKGEGIQSILRGMVTDKCKKFGSFGFELQNKLFGKIENNEFTAIDLLSANIQRGRDHGIRPYVDYVKICHGIDAKDFNDLLPLTTAENILLLRNAYQNVGDVDLYPGSILEEKISNLGLVSSTFACIIKRQFADLKNGDRFYYENGPSVNPSAFTLDQLAEIKKVTLSGLICSNYDISSLPQRVFFLPTFENPKVSCDNLKNQINLDLWTGIL
ncbi:Dual oxidase 2 [Brachionus plicatilis]|uniref:Dual oxidase 2 n=1 Tax=Brachionus plicatilis TaxID=10195 RepID=A0A3M7SUM7_BRAPC|nr:Dual oxidase 2 [Brachionus plicatilis]